MTSIITNTGAMVALKTLRDVSRQLEVTQDRMASGLRVGQSSQNAAYWSIAATMRSDDKALAAVQDAMNLGAATADTAYAGLDSSIDVVDEIKSKLIAAREPGVDKDKVNKEIDQLKQQLVSITDAASFNGVNWLKISDGSDTTAKVAASFYRSVDRSVFMETITLDLVSSDGTVTALVDNRSTSTNGGGGIFTSTQFATNVGAASNYVLVANQSNTSASAVEIAIGEATTADQLDDMIAVVDEMLQMMADAGANIGSVQSRVDLQLDYVYKLRDWMKGGISTLVDADMDEEATRLKALTTQEQLATQALSIANTEQQNILSLFR
ncbi:flagellin [Rhizobium sp. CSW-27]|uniref:flagellin N-terminal helical domain-containing protein n=1 Tax=Rhizobium sp. CSW-27 TaxID=2839985 RepID=UPI001C029C5F|nr:flagellin [Rhizobium sp. CSW-27]MBT9368520.1 flagellin [Rhizobium sp. CSW-27]